MLTASCKTVESPNGVATFSVHSRASGNPGPPSSVIRFFPGSPLSRGRTESVSINRKTVSLHIISEPVLDHRDPGAVPPVHPIELPGAEMVVLGPLDRAAAQPLEVDVEVLQRGLHLGGARRSARALERGLDRHAGDPALRHLLGRVFAARGLGGVADLLLD